MIPSDFIITHAPMHLHLEILKKCNFFWLRDIRNVDISQCCAKCFIGDKDNRVYYGTLHKSNAVVDIIVKQHPHAKAYYLCGLSDGFVWELNTHVAFVPDSNSEVRIENDRIKLHITNAPPHPLLGLCAEPSGELHQRAAVLPQLDIRKLPKGWDAVMIVSASRRTDIPALFSEWFYNRVGKGFVLLRNPYNPLQVGRVSLTPDQSRRVVFWTRMPRLCSTGFTSWNAFKYYFQYTITPYGRDVEKNIPTKHEVVIPAFKKIGADKAIWRYDPVFLNDRYTWDYHIRAFTKIAEELEGYTSKAVMSFVDSYRTVDLRPLNIQPLTTEQQTELAQQLSEIAARHGIVLSSCAEELGLPHSSCVDGKMFGVDKPKDRNQRGLCQCVESVDIGAYSTCRNGCAYCYANHYGYVQDPPDADCDLLGPPLNGNEKIKQRN